MTDIMERLGVLATSLANPQVAVDAQRELERLRAQVNRLNADRTHELENCPYCRKLGDHAYTPCYLHGGCTEAKVEVLEDGMFKFTCPVCGVDSDKVRQQQKEIERLRSLIVCGFYEDETPTFRQGEPQHELESAVTAEECTGMVAEIERLRGERDTFYMDYRIKCDEETKRLEVELAAAKAFLLEVLDQCRETDKMLWDNQLYKRIRAALGDEPADRGPGHQPE